MQGKTSNRAPLSLNSQPATLNPQRTVNLPPATRNTFLRWHLSPFLALCCLCVVCTISIAASTTFRPFIQSVPEGRIDWDNGFFYGTGLGYPHLNDGSRAKALKVAQAKALSAILQVASGLNVDAERTLGELEKEKAVIRIRAMVQYEPFQEEFVQEGKNPFYRVTYRAAMKGVKGLTRQILPFLRSQSGAGTGSGPGQAAQVEEEGVPWLVLDARRIDRSAAVQPALFPRILTEKGEVLSDIHSVEEQALAQKGMARYVVTDKSRQEIMSLLREKGPDGLARLRGGFPGVFGVSPAMAEEKGERKRQARYIVKDVTQVQGLKKTNLVISESDARELKDEDTSSQILRKCRVIVVVSSSAGGIEGLLPSLLASYR